MKGKRMVQVIRTNEIADSLIAKKIGRNSICPCGSGKKAKKCCGNETQYFCKRNLPK